MADDISEDICDDWEDMVENGVLEKKLERLKVKTNSANSNNANPPSSGGGAGGVGEVAVMPRVLLEDSVRTQYTPAVKILKRPPDASRSGGSVNGTGSEKSPIRQPVKSLQQREAEYAEARLRILGSARSEDDGQKDKSSGVSVLNHMVTDPQQVPIRQPRGPDQGSNGFQQPRR
uniref:SUZ RNA-binding domain-containing n=1 Tax=Rhipicephalus appendiculatus TaxID=34631 RepID=A0A131YY17_RHIAP